jgi:type IV secretory pathway VirB4 component
MAKKNKRPVTKKKKAMKPSSQAHLSIAEVKEGTVIMRDGTLRAILMVSSVNFALKSEDEQNAMISSYVGFLNSIDFPLQVVIQSRQLQVGPYLDDLIKREKEMKNELLRLQIADYRAFVQELIDIGQIMTKKFYVVIPYDPVSNKKKGFFARAQEVLRPAMTVRLKGEKFMQRKEDLELRVRTVSGGLSGMGLNVVPLDTQSLIELYYTSYNPDIAFSEQLGDVQELRVENS